MLPEAFLAAIQPLPVLKRLLASGPAPDGELRRRVETIARAAFGESPVVDDSAYALFEAGLFYAVDALDPAHAVFQDDHSPHGSYWHGMLHRREGDFWNSKYWLQRAGKISALRGFRDFDPVAFVNRCERVAGKDPEELLSLQRMEWEQLMQAAYEKATAR